MFKNFNWGHGIILALGSFIAFILFLIFVFSNGQQTAEMVSDDYYADELNYQNVIDAKKNADLLKDSLRYEQFASGIKVNFPQSINPENGKVHFDLFRTNDANLDVKKDLNLDAQKSFIIPKQILSPGSYTLKVKWSQNKKPYQIDYDVQWK